MYHGFDTDVAVEVGMPAATILHHIVYWCKRNEEEGKNFRDGRYWLFNTQAELASRFPYMSERTLRRALADLKDSGYLLVGNYNRATFDRTTWYTPSDKALKVYANLDISSGQFDLIKSAHVDRDNTLINQNNTPPIIPPQAAKPKPKPKPKVDLAQFDVFWTAYPKKVDKQDAVKVWEKLNPNAELFEKIMSGLNRSVAFDHRFRERQYTPAPARWLRAENWNDEFELPKPMPQQTQQSIPKPKKDLAAQMREILPEKSAPPPPEVDAMIEEWKRNNNWR
jgi:hypothetical protein